MVRVIVVLLFTMTNSLCNPINVKYCAVPVCVSTDPCVLGIRSHLNPMHSCSLKPVNHMRRICVLISRLTTGNTADPHLPPRVG